MFKPHNFICWVLLIIVSRLKQFIKRGCIIRITVSLVEKDVFWDHIQILSSMLKGGYSVQKSLIISILNTSLQNFHLLRWYKTIVSYHWSVDTRKNCRNDAIITVCFKLELTNLNKDKTRPLACTSSFNSSSLNVMYIT